MDWFSARAWALATLGTLTSACSFAFEDDGLAGQYVDEDGTGSSGDAPLDVGSSETGPSTTGGDGTEPGGDPEGPRGGHAADDEILVGSWRDLDHWEEWHALFVEGSPWRALSDSWAFDPFAARFPVLVESGGMPAVDVEVVLVDQYDAAAWTARTDAFGRAELFAAPWGDGVAGPLAIVVGEGAEALVLDDVSPSADAPIVVELPSPSTPADVLDLMLVVDATASMSEELTYLQSRLGDIFARIRDLAPTSALRLSVVLYRDAGDEYVVRSFPFTEDVELALEQLAVQTASGGGDVPEAVAEALDAAVLDHDWSASARARLLVLVHDAPAHPETIHDVQSSVLHAARLGIRVVPVAGDGVDESTQCFGRMVEVATAGTYVFRVEPDGGEPFAPAVGPFAVEPLDERLVRLVAEALGES